MWYKGNRNCGLQEHGTSHSTVNVRVLGKDLISDFPQPPPSLDLSAPHIFLFPKIKMTLNDEDFKW
jgi:hypothetical protein